MQGPGPVLHVVQQVVQRPGHVVLAPPGTGNVGLPVPQVEIDHLVLLAPVKGIHVV